MPRFSILEHDHPQLHWDLLLEHGPTCRTWRLSAPPDCSVRIEAEELPAHRLMYLNYSGPVSGNRGQVTPWDAGEFEWLTESAHEVHILLKGTRWTGTIRLTRADQNWTVEINRGL